MRTKLIMLICIVAVALFSIFASSNNGPFVKVCVGGVAKCLKYAEADKLVKQGLGVYGDCSAGTTGKIIKCHPKKGL